MALHFLLVPPKESLTMCGIAGFLNLDYQNTADLSLLRAMTDVLEHRGPDADGHFISGPVALGHRRLSIIDLNTGQQPMANDDGSITLSFNGEIYNYVELRVELLALGHGFQTDSDTEVIIRAYEQWGIDCQKRFNGMWSFALWDENHQRLFLSRDRLGEKPLYYSNTGKTLVFGSELKALFAYGISRDPDLSLLEVYTTLSFIPAPFTFFKNVHKLRPGHCLVYEDGSFQDTSYWDLPELDEDDMRQDGRAVEEEFAALLQDSVRMRMRSDVPFGAFLSGGLDSSCIVALMSQIGEHPVRTFTMGFEQREFDERDLARLVAQAFKTYHHEQVVTPDVFEESVSQVLHHYDEPFGDVSAIPTGLVSRMAREHVKMVLTGDGGDEVLSGYTIYQGEKFAHRYSKLPFPLRKSLPPLARGLGSLFRGRPRRKLNRVHDVCQASDMAFSDRLIEKVANAPVRLIKELLAPVNDKVDVRDFMANMMEGCPYKDPFYRLMHYNLKVSLPGKMLVKVDRMSMAHSLEVRAPFLDHRLVDLMVPVHKDIKMRGLERKSVLRRTTATILPEKLLHTSKKGFAVPVGHWFKDAGFNAQMDALAAGEGLHLAETPLREVLAANREGRADYGNLLWLLTVADRAIRAT